MKIKENYTREEANFMSILSSLIGDNPNTFQGDAAYWDFVNVDFEACKVKFDVSVEQSSRMYYLIAGACITHDYKFEEVM